MAENGKDQDNHEQVNSISSQPTQADMEKLQSQLQEAQKKIEKQGKDLGEYDAYVRDATVLAQIISSDPDLQKSVRKQYVKLYGGGSDQGEDAGEQEKEDSKKKGSTEVENEQITQLNERLIKTEKTTRNQVIGAFEERVGISGLSDEKKKEFRRDIEGYVNRFGSSIGDAPIEQLETVLDTAFKAVGDRYKELSTSAQQYTNSTGSLPHVSGRNLNEAQDNSKLSKAESDWLDKLNVDPEKAKKVKENKDTEWNTPSKAEQKKDD